MKPDLALLETIRLYVDDRCNMTEQKVDDLLGTSVDLKDAYDTIFALYPGTDLTRLVGDHFAVAGKVVHPRVFVEFLRLQRENRELQDALRMLRVEIANRQGGAR